MCSSLSLFYCIYDLAGHMALRPCAIYDVSQGVVLLDSGLDLRQGHVQELTGLMSREVFSRLSSIDPEASQVNRGFVIHK